MAVRPTVNERGPRPWLSFDLRLRIGHLDLRIPTDDDLAELAEIAAAGPHPPEEMPFGFAWTDSPPDRLPREFMQFHWRIRSEWSPEKWSLEFGVREAGRLVGMQALHAQDFGTFRTVSTGSWLGREFQGRGIGKQMRAAVLALAFDHLGARVATWGALADNVASTRVSRALGYTENGVDEVAPRGVPRELVRYRLSAEAWRGVPRPPVEVVGVEPCRSLLGAGAET